MNCHLSRLLLAFRPDELAVEDRVALQAHLNTCGACAASAAAEVAADSAVRQAMCAVPVPAGLRARLMANADATQSAAWWRKVTHVGSGLLAATICVALGIGLTVYLTRPNLNPERAGSYLESERLMREQAVGEWLRSEGLPAELPEPFEYGYHAAHGIGPLGPHRLPFVLFQNDRGQCRVYILRASAVTTASGDWAAVTGSEFNVKAVERDGYVYLIAVSTGTSLEAFLKSPSPVA